MQKTLLIIQIVLAVLLIVSILLQHRGTSLGGAFGGAGEVYRSRRGIEKFLFYLTITLALLFVIMAIVNLLV
ncbi:MAG: preprotein translocase subunit SecG [Patescibacteria group bacterium]|jgi:preprotein translocase subunit SecG